MLKKMVNGKSVVGRRGQGPDNEGENREEEEQLVIKSGENKNGSSSISGTDSGEKAQRRSQEIAEGQRPVKRKNIHKGQVVGLDLDYDDILSAWPSNKGIFIEESQTEAVVTPKAKKGMVVDVASETNADRKRKKKEETDDYQGAVTDSEEVCKKIKKEPNNDDDGTDDDDGTVGGTHTNVSSVGLEIAAGN